MKMLIAAVLGLTALGMLVAMPQSYAGEQTTTIPLGEDLNLEKTITTMTVPENNTLPWGHVKGHVNNPAENYPVIIQFYQGDIPVHFAQVDLNGDDTYEYTFRVRNVVDGNPINIFEGSYTVKIFKVVTNVASTV